MNIVQCDWGRVDLETKEVHDFVPDQLSALVNKIAEVFLSQ